MYCLHNDINALYNPLLKKYFAEQDKREDKQTLAEINKIERCGIYHRDIKAINIVIDYLDPIENNIDSITVQLIDFGMAGITNFEKYNTKTNCGSEHYMAPEMKNGEKYTEKIDIWSAVVMLFEHLNNGGRMYKKVENNNRLRIEQPLIDS